jgi:hypothetical protein
MDTAQKDSADNGVKKKKRGKSALMVTPNTPQGGGGSTGLNL